MVNKGLTPFQEIDQRITEILTDEYHNVERLMRFHDGLSKPDKISFLVAVLNRLAIHKRRAQTGGSS